MFEAVDVEVDGAVEGRQEVRDVRHRLHPWGPGSLVLHEVNPSNIEVHFFILMQKKYRKSKFNRNFRICGSKILRKVTGYSIPAYPQIAREARGQL